jgi:hypothetical protein
MNSITNNSISLTKTYTDLLTTDYNTIKELTDQYQLLRNRIQKTICPDDGCVLDSRDFNDKLNKYLNPGGTVGLNNYKHFYTDKEMAAAIIVSKQIDTQINQMAYHSIAYNEQLKIYLSDWRDLLAKNDLTKDGEDSKIVVATIDQAIKDIDEAITGLKQTLNPTMSANTSIINKSIENQRNSFFNK